MVHPPGLRSAEPFTAPIFAQNVLIAEQSPAILSSLKSLLETKGYRVLEAQNGLQVIDIAESEKLDLLLLDLGLALLTTPSVIDLLRGNPELESLPIVVMTAGEPKSQGRPDLAASCDEFLGKPIDFERLGAVLDYFVPLPPSAE
jgi:CheY-like chemotaxis protein